MIVDFRVKPPIPETKASVAAPARRIQGYTEVYRDRYQDNKEFIELCDRPFDAFFETAADPAGVDVVICCGNDMETTYGSKLHNEVIADLQRRYPERVVGFAGVDPHKGMAAVRELEHAVKELGLRGLNMGPWLHKLNANDKKYYPLYAKCVELEIPVVLHTSVNFSRELKLDFGRPIYLDEVAIDFPELTIVASHSGWPWVPEMVAVAWRHPNVYLEISGIRPKYIGTPGSGWETLLQYGNSLLQDRVLWATDYPLVPLKSSVEETRALPLKEDVKRKWLGENAARLLKLRAPAAAGV